MFFQLHMFVKRFCSRFSHHCNERRSPTNSNHFFPFHRPGSTVTTTLETFYLHTQMRTSYCCCSRRCHTIAIRCSKSTAHKRDFVHLHGSESFLLHGMKVSRAHSALRTLENQENHNSKSKCSERFFLDSETSEDKFCELGGSAQE